MPSLKSNEIEKKREGKKRWDSRWPAETRIYFSVKLCNFFVWHLLITFGWMRSEFSYKLLHTLLHQGLTKQMHILKNLHHRQFLNNCIWDILCEEEGQGSKRIYLSPLTMAWVWHLNLASKSVEFAVDFHPRPKDFSDGNSNETLR